MCPYAFAQCYNFNIYIYIYIYVYIFSYALLQYLSSEAINASVRACVRVRLSRPPKMLLKPLILQHFRKKLLWLRPRGCRPHRSAATATFFVVENIVRPMVLIKFVHQDRFSRLLVSRFSSFLYLQVFYCSEFPISGLPGFLVYSGSCLHVFRYSGFPCFPVFQFPFVHFGLFYCVPAVLLSGFHTRRHAYCRPEP
jgi:hypothetical protein